MSKEKIEAYRKTLYQIIFKTDTRAGKIFDIVLLVLILVSVLSTVADSIIAVHDRFRLAFKILEWFITTCFTVEYILRIYCSPQPKKYIFSFYGVIDLLAIMPTYLNVFFKGAHHLTVIRLLRLLRIFRIFKLTHFVKESKYLLQAIRQSIAKIVVFIFFVILLVTILGTIMYVVEGHVNRGFSDIPKAIYWAIVTLTTVGYGDITPITVFGQLIAAIIMLLGYAIIAVPTGIISAEMIKPLYGKRKWTICRGCGENNHDKEAIYCKHCGTKLEE